MRPGPVLQHRFFLLSIPKRLRKNSQQHCGFPWSFCSQWLLPSHSTVHPGLYPGLPWSLPSFSIVVWRLGAVATSWRGDPWGHGVTDHQRGYVPSSQSVVQYVPNISKYIQIQYLTIYVPNLSHHLSHVPALFWPIAEKENSAVFPEKARPSRGEIQNVAQLLKLEAPSTLLGPQGWLKSGLQNKKQPGQL